MLTDVRPTPSGGERLALRDRYPRAAFLLGHVHRVVGLAHRLGRREALRVGDDADRCPDPALGRGAVRKAGEHPLRDALRDGGIRAREEEGELVAAEPRDQVRLPYRAAEDLRDVLEREVA